MTTPIVITDDKARIAALEAENEALKIGIADDRTVFELGMDAITIERLEAENERLRAALKGLIKTTDFNLASPYNGCYEIEIHKIGRMLQEREQAAAALGDE